MKTKQIQVYEYDELKPDIQEKVISEFINNNDFPFLNDSLNENLRELLEQNKIKSDDFELFYSLSYSKGDGLCFTGNFEWKGYDIVITHELNYCHNRSTEIYFNEEEQEDELAELISNKLFGDKEKEFKELYYKICDEIEKNGYEYIDYENSEKGIKELIELNEYTFRENGEIENL